MVAGCVVWHLVRQLHVSIHVIVISPVFSDQYTHAVQTYLDTISAYHVHDIARLLVQHCPAVARVRSAYRSGMRIMYVEPAVLKCLLNDTHVFDEHGRAYHQKCFDASMCAHLPVLHTSTEFSDVDNRALARFVRDIPQSLLASCSITWHAPYEIYFQLSELPYSMLGRFDQIPDEKVFKQIVRAYQHARQTMPKTKFDEIDVRFRGQIIVGSHIGG